MIRKYFVIGMLILMAQAGYSQKNVNQLFKEFSNIEQANKVHLGEITFALASVFTETMGVNGIEVFEFNNCNKSVKEKLASAIKDLKDSTFETMINANENGSHTKVMIRLQDETIRELVVVTTGHDNSLIRIKGKIKPSDVEKVMKEHKKDGCREL